MSGFQNMEVLSIRSVKGDQTEPDIRVTKVLKFASQLPFSPPVDCACMLREAEFKQNNGFKLTFYQ